MAYSNNKLSRRDFLRGGILFGLAILGGLVVRKKNGWKEALEKPVSSDWQITIDGQIIQQGRFMSGYRKDLYVQVKNGTAHIVLDGDRIFVHEDNDICPKKICSKMGSIARPGESIICLPNKLVIRVL
jgi:hypothetical protein